MWQGVEVDLLSIYTVKAHLAAEQELVEGALAVAQAMVATADQWGLDGTIPGTFACDFGDAPDCTKLVTTNKSVIMVMRDFLLSEQAYLASFLTALDTVVVECSPGNEKDEPCGNCGWKIFVCGADGVWPEDAECTAEGECVPGTEDEQVCGNCGLQKRLCSQNCTYSEWGGCTDEGECAAGDEKLMACGDCGVQTQPCTEECAWGEIGECVGPDYVVCYADGDEDGFGGEETPEVCECPTGTVEQDGDCDDENEEVHPDAEEICNEIDDDCDDDIDEDDVCVEPSPEPEPDVVEQPDVVVEEDVPDEPTPDVPVAGEDVPETPEADVADDAAGDAAAEEETKVSKGDDGCTVSTSGRFAAVLPLLLLIVALAGARRRRC